MDASFIVSRRWWIYFQLLHLYYSRVGGSRSPGQASFTTQLTCSFLTPVFLQATTFVYTNPSRANQENIFSLCGLRSVFSVPLSIFSTLHVLEKSAFVYRPLSYTIANSLASSLDGKYGNIPTFEEWKIVWATWDVITLQMIPKTMLHQKPIDLRHKCLFYIGHIPTYVPLICSFRVQADTRL